jgi:hypothetical protein
VSSAWPLPAKKCANFLQFNGLPLLILTSSTKAIERVNIGNHGSHMTRPLGNILRFLPPSTFTNTTLGVIQTKWNSRVTANYIYPAAIANEKLRVSLHHFHAQNTGFFANVWQFSMPCDINNIRKTWRSEAKRYRCQDIRQPCRKIRFVSYLLFSHLYA